MTSAIHSSGARFLSSTGVCFLVEIPVKIGCWHQKQQFGALEHALRLSRKSSLSEAFGPYFAFFFGRRVSRCFRMLFMALGSLLFLFCHCG